MEYYGWGRIFLSLESSPSCHTLSNACWMSKNTAEQNFLSFSFSCFVFSEIYFFQVSLLSRVMPRYLTESLLGIIALLMVTWGQVCFRSVKVTWEDFFFVYFKTPFLEPLFHGVETSLESG